MREAWHVLEPETEFVHSWHIDAVGEHLEAVTAGHIRRLQVNQPPGTMKQIAHSTPMPTPQGWRTHGDLRIGDEVFGPDGKPTRVIGISPETVTADYEVTFSTHEVIKCHGDHLWTVYDRWTTQDTPWRTVDTRWLAEQSGPSDRHRFFIPDTHCLEFPERELPLHPYFLGCWLGDGTHTKPTLTHNIDDQEHIAKLGKLGYRVTSTYAGTGKAVASEFRHQGIIETIRQIGLFGAKRIPTAYLESSEEQRLELLAGLIDTDGCLVSKTHKVKITTVNPFLASDIQRLIVSLGMRPHVTLYDAPGYGDYQSDKTAFAIGFQPDRPIPTAITRKKATRFDFARRKRAIVNVRRTSAPEPARCITVARPDGLYVVGNTCLVTHNSLNVSVMFGAWEWGPANRPGLRYLTTSYTETYARRDSRRMRDLVLSEWYRALWPGIVLTRDNETDFENTYRGGRRAMPFASLTAGRGNRVIIDDPHSTEGAESDTDREKATRIFRESVTSRLNNQSRDTIIVMMHRLHPHDICGVIDELGLPYTKLVLPMEYVRSLVVKTPFYTDPRTEDGELLCPTRVPRETVEGMKVELGPHAYDTQFQQQPRAREGTYFYSREMILLERKNAAGEKEFYPCERPKLCDAVFAIVDTATKVGKSRDGTGVIYFAYSKHPKPAAVLLDWDIVQVEADLLIRWLPDVMRVGEELAKQCGARMGWQGALIEDKDSGQILLQGARRIGMKVHAIDKKWANAGKDGRAVSAGGYVRKGWVKMCREAYDKTMPWKGRVANHCLVQVTTFRFGVGTQNDSDEMFDCFTYGALAAFGDAKEL